MKVFWYFLMLFLPLKGSAQGYVSFPDSNATWVNVAYYVDGPFPFLTWQYVTTVDNYCVGNQDTVIGAYTYNQIHYCEGNYKGAYRDNGGQVFFIPKDSTAEIIWYDFTLDEGDTINSYSETLWMCDYYIVSNIDSVEINGIYRTIVEFEMGDPWIEGIGCTSGLFWDHCANNNISGGYFELYCFSQNDTIYDPVSYNFIPGVQCLLPQVGFENKSEFSLIDVYPNPVTDKFNLIWNKSQAPSLKLINAYGVMVEPDLQYLSNKIEVDITAFPDGVYFLVVQDSEHINTAKIIKQ